LLKPLDGVFLLLGLDELSDELDDLGLLIGRRDARVNMVTDFLDDPAAIASRIVGR
jgi:hypothetical protein